MMLQRKFTANWRRNTPNARKRSEEDGARYTRAAPMPIRAKRMIQTMGNTMLGGERGGFSTTAS